MLKKNLFEADILEKEKDKVNKIDSFLKKISNYESIKGNKEDLYRMLISALYDLPNGEDLINSLLLLTSDNFRTESLQYIKNPITKLYWEDVYPKIKHNIF